MFVVSLALIDSRYTIRAFVKVNESAPNPSRVRISCTSVRNHHRCLSALFAHSDHPFRFCLTINTRFRVQHVWGQPETLAKTRNQWLSVSHSRWNFALRLFNLTFFSWTRWSTGSIVRIRKLPIRLTAKWTFKCRERKREKELFFLMSPIFRDGCPGTTSSLETNRGVVDVKDADGSLRFKRS